MSRKTSQTRIEANRRNAQKSTGPRTDAGKAKSATNATTHGLSSFKQNPLAPGSFLNTEDQAAFQGLLEEYVATYNPQQRDEYDLVTEAVFAKWRQQRLWIAETNQLEVAIALTEADLQKALPLANANAHLANAIAKSESVLKLYLRYDAQFRRHYRQCLNDLTGLQASRLPPDDSPIEPNGPVNPTTNDSADPPPTAPTQPTPNEPKLTPEQARLHYMQAEIQRFEDLQDALRARQREENR